MLSVIRPSGSGARKHAVGRDAEAPKLMISGRPDSDTLYGRLETAIVRLMEDSMSGMRDMLRVISG